MAAVRDIDGAAAGQLEAVSHAGQSRCHRVDVVGLGRRLSCGPSSESSEH